MKTNGAAKNLVGLMSGLHLLADISLGVAGLCFLIILFDVIAGY